MASHRCTSVMIVTMTIVILMVQINLSSAKQRSSGKLRFIPYKKTSRTIRTGGCSAFGHSCFGGHGKRADEDVLLLPGSDSDQQSRLEFQSSGLGAGQEEGDEMLQPRTGGYGVRSPASASASAGVSALIPPPHSAQYNLSPFLRQWLQSYRRSTGDIEVK